MTVRVKICGMTRGDDVRLAVDAGADALGFVFTPRSERVLEPARAAPLVASVPAFIARVGLFMDQDAALVREVIRQVPVTLLQFHGRETPAYCRQFGLPYIKALSMGQDAQEREAGGQFHDAAALLLDSHAPGGAGGTGQVFDWTWIPVLGRPLILAGGLNPANVRQAVEQVQPWAVDVSSGVEDSPGVKNEAKMREFIKEAKCEH